MTVPIEPAFKINEFAYIIFNRRNGEPQGHGRTEKAAWMALVQKRPPHRNLTGEKDFFELEVRLKKIDHVAISCEAHGGFIWDKRISLDNVRSIICKA